MKKKYLIMLTLTLQLGLLITIAQPRVLKKDTTAHGEITFMQLDMTVF